MQKLTQSDLKKKQDKLKELHNIENEKNKEIGKIDRQIKSAHHSITKMEKQKQKLAKSISHNMKLRNKIISELC